jgi:DNA-binding NtrC family response regulator
MATMTAPFPPATTRIKHRTALIASADASFRQRLCAILSGLRWQVREAQGGAQAWGEAMDALPQTIVVDSWLPDLDVDEFIREFRTSFPNVDVVTNDGGHEREAAAGPFRQEIFYALGHVQDGDTAAWNAAPMLGDGEQRHFSRMSASGALTAPAPVVSREEAALTEEDDKARAPSTLAGAPKSHGRAPMPAGASERIPELVGHSPCMLDVSRRIRCVAARSTPVLIEGPTGSGKEVVAEALHRLSSRSRKPFVAINCAAIPEALLEAELFGHTRGAFTGAVQGRVGRIEAADGGTLFLDEIGEMPLGLQAKLLRFVESGELQRVGDNAAVKVDVRILAATHQPLAQHTQSGNFRADLYYRLAVFLIRTPALGEHLEDLPLLVDHFLEKMGREMAVKRIEDSVLAKLRAHNWPGNVRELQHVLERAAILAGDDPVLTAADIEFGMLVN